MNSNYYNTRNIYNIIFSIIIYIVYTILFISCKRDVGSNKLNTVEGSNLLISGINTNYVIPMGDSITIFPIVKNQDGTEIDTTLYTTFWTQVSILNGAAKNGTEAFDTIFGNNFIYFLSFANTKNIGASTWTYKIINKKTGIFTQQQFTINAYTPTSEGFYIMSQIGLNQSRLGMIYYNPKIDNYDTISDILTTMYEKEHIVPPFNMRGNPISVNYGTTNLASFFGDFISVITDQNATFLNPNTLTLQGNNKNSEEAANFSNLLGSVVNSYSPKNIRSYTPSIYYGFGIINYNGYLYQDNSVITYQILNFDNSPLVSPSDAENIFASKWIALNDNLQSVDQYLPNSILFDENKQIFYKYYYGELYNLPISGYTSKNKLLYNHYTDYGGGRFYAILQSNNSDSTYLLSYNASGTMYSYNYLGKDNFDSTTHFAISSTNGYLFYNIGNSIYEYDIVKNQSYPMLQYPGKVISYMEGPQIPWNINASERTLSLSQSIIIATYDPSNLLNSGTLDVYNIPAANGSIQRKNSYTGFGKIVSMTYKQSYP